MNVLAATLQSFLPIPLSSILHFSDGLLPDSIKLFMSQMQMHSSPQLETKLEEPWSSGSLFLARMAPKKLLTAWIKPLDVSDALFAPHTIHTRWKTQHCVFESFFVSALLQLLYRKPRRLVYPNSQQYIQRFSHAYLTEMITLAAIAHFPTNNT